MKTLYLGSRPARSNTASNPFRSRKSAARSLYCSLRTSPFSTPLRSILVVFMCQALKCAQWLSTTILTKMPFQAKSKLPKHRFLTQRLSITAATCQDKCWVWSWGWGERRYILQTNHYCNDISTELAPSTNGTKMCTLVNFQLGTKFGNELPMRRNYPCLPTCYLDSPQNLQKVSDWTLPAWQQATWTAH